MRFVERLNRSESPGFDGEATAQQVQETFEELRYDLALRDEAGNVVGVLAGSTDGPTLLLQTHMDTARRGKSRFLGHETAHRAALAAQVFGSCVLDRSPLAFCGTLVVAACITDRNGWGNGTDHLVRETLSRLGLKPALAILGEPTGLHLLHGGPGLPKFLCEHPLFGHTGLQLKTWGTEHCSLRAAGSVLLRRHQVPTLCFGPGQARFVYSSNESVTHGATYEATRGFAMLAYSMLGSPRPS
jgi:hypothetical protein